MKNLIRSIVASAFAALSFAVAAAPVTVSGSLATTDGTYNRALSVSSLSAVGTNVYYDTYQFQVSVSGAYTLQTTAAAFAPGPADDTFISLYASAFNPAFALANLVAVDDDSGPGALSILTSALTAGTNYFFVVSSFNNGQTGTYSAALDSATGVGQVILAAAPGQVPEPGSLALLGLGLAGLAAIRKRKQA